MPVTDEPTMRLLGSRSVSGVVALDDVGTLVDLLRPAPARGEPVLVVVPRDDGPAARRTLSMARAAAPGSHAVVHETSLPPLARGHLVDVLGSLSPRLTAGELLIACELVEASVVAGALLHSVTRLGSPAPSMGQHVRSWLPSSRFLALTQPEPAVTLLDARFPDDVGLPQTRPGWRMTRTPADPGDEAAVLLLAERLTGGPADEVPAPAASQSRWASTFCEFAAFPTDLVTSVRAAVAEARACRSCGAALVWSRCRVCGAHQGDGPTTTITPTTMQTNAPNITPTATSTITSTTTQTNVPTTTHSTGAA